MTTTHFDTNRKLINLPKLCEHYGIDTIRVLINHMPTVGKIYWEIKPEVEELMRLKAWIAYIPTENRLIFSKNLLGVENHWLSTLESDYKNNRIDLLDYVYGK